MIDRSSESRLQRSVSVPVHKVLSYVTWLIDVKIQSECASDANKSETAGLKVTT